MLPTLADLPEDATVESDGFLEKSDVISSFEREFEAEGLAMEIGSSKVINVTVSVELQSSAASAMGPVMVFNAVDPEYLALGGSGCSQLERRL